jgi:hypothetical protein
MIDKDKNKEQLPDAKRSKKAYRQPQLQVYGDLREITQTTSNTSKNLDGAKMKVDKTS